MRIGLDARTVYRPIRRGTGKNLIDLYTHLALARPHWQVLAYHRSQDAVPPLLPSDNTTPKMIEMPGDRVDAWMRWRLPFAARADHAAVLHCPANQCPSWMPMPTVVTIHDLIPLDMPEGRPAADIRRFEQSVRNACRDAAWVICPSNYTRDRLISEFDADPDFVTANPWAPDKSVRPVSDEDAEPVLKRYGIQRSGDGNGRAHFVLHFGAAAPRKNTGRMLEAWTRMSHNEPHDWRLLIVGLDEETRTNLRDLAKILDVEQSVRLHGFADEADLPALLSSADLLAYPSLSEGFGLPMLDAWAAGTAVMTGNRTSLPEVAGNAAFLVDPTDTDDIARALSRLIGDAPLRAELVERGRNRLTHYNWQRTTETFARVLEHAAASSPLRAAA